MIESRSNTEQVAVRCERYLEELREFFRSSGIRFGSPENLTGLTERLRDDVIFRDEMGSMTRSIVFREGGSVPPAELLSLLAVAVGGAQVSDTAQQLHVEMRDLLRFTASVVRAPVNQPRSGRSPSVAASGRPDRIPASSGPVVGSTMAGSPEGLKDAASDGRRLSSWPAGVERFASHGNAWWWISAAGAAIAAVLLLFWPSHTSVRSVPGPQSISPRMAMHAPEGVPEPKGGEGVEASLPVESADPTAVSGSDAIRDSGGSARQVPAKKDKRSALSFDSRRLPAGAAIEPATIPGEVKKHPTPQTVASARLPSDGHAVTQVKAQPEGSPSSHLAPVADRNNPRPLGSERSSAKVAAKPSRHDVLDVSSGVMSAYLVSAPAPEYPKVARVIHLQGAVILQAVIGRNGMVLTTHVLRGHYLLRGAAVQAVEKWRYRPFLADGHPVDVATVVTVDFRRDH